MPEVAPRSGIVFIRSYFACAKIGIKWLVGIEHCMAVGIAEGDAGSVVHESLGNRTTTSKDNVLS